MTALDDAISELRRSLPRVFELRDSVRDSHYDNFFREFETSTLNIPAKRRAFERLELQLSSLDIAAWQDLKGRAVPELQRRRRGRGWQSLFDLLNEAKGFAYLQSLGCSGIHFVARTGGKTPDLKAELNGQTVLCEVKTINISETEAEHRDRVSKGTIEAREVNPSADAMLAKLSTSLRTAWLQLEEYDRARDARRLIVLIIHFDDWVGDYQDRYFAQIDAHLGQQALSGVELVVSPASNLFARRFTMKHAAVWEP